MKRYGRFRKALLILLGVILVILVLVLDFPALSSSEAIPETSLAFPIHMNRVTAFLIQTFHP